MPITDTKEPWPYIASQLTTLAESDRRDRSSGRDHAMNDHSRAEELKRIVSAYGWPHKSTVGDQAARGAWLIAQHADHTFKRRALA